ncbi:MAG: hypothetical protein K940chlam9_01576, partial [Chlamydiae bacterium]|nr:hypothetical protein [Chlamydiota bacterium]
LVKLKDNEDLKAWLSRLLGKGEDQKVLYSSGSTQKKVAEFIYESIKQAELNKDFKDSFIVCIQGAASSCDDRMITSLFEVEIYHKIAVAFTNKSLGDVAYLLGHGILVLEECRKIIMKLADEKKKIGINKFTTWLKENSDLDTEEVQKAAATFTENAVDQIEMFLYPIMELRDSLAIPISNASMIHTQFIEIYNDDDIFNIQVELTMLLNDKKGYFSFLSKNPHWQKMLETHPDTQDKYEKITENAYAALPEVSDDTDGRKRCQQVETDREDELFKLTSTVLEQSADFFEKATFLNKDPKRNNLD